MVTHPNVPALNAAALQRLYTGRSVEIEGVAVTPVHLAGADRARFVETVMAQSEADYRAYWTVRRHVGKGTPPKDLPSAQAVLDFVRTTPGGVGYIPASDAGALPAGVKQGTSI